MKLCMHYILLYIEEHGNRTLVAIIASPKMHISRFLLLRGCNLQLAGESVLDCLYSYGV